MDGFLLLRSCTKSLTDTSDIIREFLQLIVNNSKVVNYDALELHNDLTSVKNKDDLLGVSL